MTDTLVERLRAGLGPTHDVKYELGGGGMAHVFLAEERSLGRDVVIKVLPPGLSAGVSADRFAREIRVAARLQQANIVPLLSAGVADGVSFYTMPFVAGESLRDLLRRTPRLSIAQTLAIATDVARALHYAHAHGVAHRDVKPENILLSGATAVVTDFGIAKALAAAKLDDRAGDHAASEYPDYSTAALTSIGTSLGTPAYMAPEQALGDPATDHRADFYALGVTVYEMLAGRPPFDARTPHELMAAHITEQPAPLETLRDDVPVGLARVVSSCLAKDRTDRPPDAAALLDMLAAIDTNTTARAGDAAPATRPRRMTIVVAGAAVVALAGVATIYAIRDTAAAPSELDAARVLVASASSDARDPALTTIVEQATDLIARTVQSLQSVRRVESVAGLRGDDAARARARTIGARTLFLADAEPRGPDSVRLRFRVLDTQTGALVRAMRPIDVRRGVSDSGFRAALDPAFAVLTIVTEPALGPEALPLVDPPKFVAARELATGLVLGAADSVKRDVAMAHIDRAVALDASYYQARLWQTQFVQDNYAPTYFVRSRLIGDTTMREVAPNMEQLSNFERALYDYVVAAHLGRVPEVIEALRRLRSIAPEAPPTALLPRILMDQNRPREALQVVRSLPPARDANGKRIRPEDDASRWALIASIDHYLGDRAGNIAAANHLHRLAPDVMATARAELVAAAWDGDSAHIRDILNTARTLPSRPGSYDFFGDLEMQVGQELMAHGHDALGQQLIRDAITWFNSHPSNDRRLVYRKALAYYALADYKRAAQTLAPLLADTTASPMIGLAGRIAARMGDTVEALRRARQLERMTDPGLLGAPTQERAFIAAGLGHRAEAVALLQDAFAQGIGWNIWWRLHWFPDTTPLRGYAPFDRLLEPRG